MKEEKWTSLWYRLHFTVEFGRKGVVEQSSEMPSQEQLKRKEEAINAVIFFRHCFIAAWIQWPWSLLRRSRTKGDAYVTDMEAFRRWLDKEYPDVEFQGLDKRRLGYSRIFSGIFLQVLITAILAGLTRFRFDTRSHAAWLLVWMYGGPMLRYTWLNDHTMHRKPCLNPGKWLLFFIDRMLHVAIIVGVCGGTAVICVELFGNLCNTTFSLAPGTWVLVGFSIAAFFLVTSMIVIGIPKLLGTRILIVTNT